MDVKQLPNGRVAVELDEELVDKIRARVRSDTPEGFIWFYYLVAPPDWPLPDHCVEWIIKYYEARAAGKNLAIEAFRGSLKSTIFTIFLTAYMLGLYPSLETIFVQGNDSQANNSSKDVADIIAYNSGFRLLFPNIVPDPDRGWGAQGYEVKDKSIAYGGWVKKKTKCPGLMGAGYKAADILGNHPRMHGIMDDVCNHKNTRSPRELHMVVNKIAKEVRPAFDRVKMQIDVFTPWVPDDVGDRAKRRENTLHVLTPIYTVGENDEVIPTWPEVFPIERIEELKQEHGPVEFAQMYMCDLEATMGQQLKKEWLHSFPHEEIDETWPVVIGVDYASVAKHQELRGRDHFALAVVAIHPNGYGIVIDGWYGHLSRAEAEPKLMDYALKYGDRLRLVGIETHGKSEEFYNVMLASAPFPIRPQTTGNKSKGERFENQMAPVFRGFKMRLSDDPSNKFLKQFVREWLSWDGTEHYLDDCLDAVYYAVRLIKGLMKAKDTDLLHEITAKAKGAVVKNPLFKFAKR